MAIGTIIPPRPASTGIARRRRSRSSPRSNSRRASSPITKKKKVIRPLFTQPCRSSDMLAPPRRIDSGVCQTASYEAALTFAHTSAASVAARSTAALPVWVRRNRRSGVWRFRVHAVWLGAVAAGRDSVTPRFSPTAGPGSTGGVPPARR